MNMATISSLMLLAVLCAGLSEVKTVAAATPTPPTSTKTESTTVSTVPPNGGGTKQPSVSGTKQPSVSGTKQPSVSGTKQPSVSAGNQTSNTGTQGGSQGQSGGISGGGKDSSTSTTVPTTTLSVEDKITGWIPHLTCADKSCKQEYEAVKNATKVKKDFCDAYDDYKKCFDDDSKTCGIKTDTLDDVNKFCSGCSLQASVVLFLVAIFASLM